ncbi:tryptophan halogenase family protein [Qipengyuania sphaerica]|uniref:tryptophan halogenase family protein n=1 Tax=Qipengyuania sphaerica TaxID=2867243 RepID=UPI001C880737|nr:tryptophan halogenase family protein [Qipengyuania sphaerica]MBX7541222.1 tryptophan 7-halogenase [Qipengyuania sphaerica]
MLTDASIRKIVIVGGGTAGWMAASAFGKLLVHPDIEICLIESEAIGTVGVGEATIPHIRYFNQLLGLQEDDFVRRTNATFKLGIEFVDWGKLGESYIHPFGAYGVDMEGLRFHQFWLRHKALGRHHSLDDYNLQVMAAKAGKFQRPVPEPNSPLGQIEYAFHFDSNLYAKYLRAFAENRGVVRKEGKVVSVDQNAETGFVESVTLESGEKIEGELFIDCSGFRGLLIEQALESGYEDWSRYLPCNSAVTVQCERVADPIPYTRSTARPAGWQWRIPLQSRTGNGYVYSRDHISDDEAAATLLQGLDGDALGEPRILRFIGGIRKQSWNKNVIALGLAAGFMEPLESTSIHLIQTAIARIMTLFPDRHFNAADIDHYNSRTLLEFEQVRDFLILHYKATERDDTPFWQYCRDMDIPDTLRERIALYEENGRLYRHDNELFGEHSWLAVMHGQNLAPERYHPLTEMMPEAELDKRMDDIRRVWKNCLDRMPGHQEFIDRNCKAQ